jgi:hypothetical protein
MSAILVDAKDDSLPHPIGITGFSRSPRAHSIFCPLLNPASALFYGTNYDEERGRPGYVAGWGGRWRGVFGRRRCRDAAAVPVSNGRSLSMNKVVIVSVAILGLSTSAALAAKTRHAKPAAAPAASAPAPETHMFQVSDADKKLYAKNKRESGMK